MKSSHVKITWYSQKWKDHHCYGYIIAVFLYYRDIIGSSSEMLGYLRTIVCSSENSWGIFEDLQKVFGKSAKRSNLPYLPCVILYLSISIYLSKMRFAPLCFTTPPCSLTSMVAPFQRFLGYNVTPLCSLRAFPFSVIKSVLDLFVFLTDYLSLFTCLS